MIVNLLLLAGCVVAATWRFPALRGLGLLLAAAAAVTPFTSGLGITEKAMAYLPIDIIGGVAGVVIFVRYREWAGLAFTVFAILSCCVHFAMFSRPPHTFDQHWYYVLCLNVLFIGSCLTIGGTGFVRLHRHLGIRRGNSLSRRFAGSGG